MQVTRKSARRADHVYVVPPNESLSMQDGYIIVSPIHTIEERRAPVDIFFRTLAESHGARAVAVILSGTGANGSMGIKRVKENGGAAFVQNPREAEFSEMPRNSIATELIDEILNVAEIPAKIVAYQEKSRQNSYSRRTGRPRRTAAVGSARDFYQSARPHRTRFCQLQTPDYFAAHRTPDQCPHSARSAGLCRVSQGNARRNACAAQRFADFRDEFLS